MFLILLLFTTMAACKALASTASKSDYGKLKLIASGDDSYVYFTEDLHLHDKLHIVLSVPYCNCIGSVDIQKINQLDYFALKSYMYSFSIYTNAYHKASCDISVSEVQALTDLDFNVIPIPAEGRREGVNITDLREFLQGLFLSGIPLAESSSDYNPFEDYYSSRIEGLALMHAMNDYIGHSHVRQHRAEILTRGGGILMMQGNVQIRPCMLRRDRPWILNDFNQDYLIKYTEKSNLVTCYSTKEDASLFNQIVDTMIASGIIKPVHLQRLERNNGAIYNVKVFPFQALYVPFDEIYEFLPLLSEFSNSGLCPFVYIPFIYQMLWDSDIQWKYYTRADNMTLRLGEPLLKDCSARTMDELVDRVDVLAAQTLFYYAISECGGKVEYIIKRTRDMASSYVAYEVLFYILLSWFILSNLWLFRSRIYVCLCTTRRSFRYSKLPTASQMHDI